MRRRLTRSDYIFSGIKTFHELNEAFPSLLDENGNRKPFEQFLNDVRKIDETYNEHNLSAEYNFVQQSANMAAKWEDFSRDGDRYLLQYRTAADDRVRPAHAALEGVTLPPSDTFWSEYYPPNGWNCRCTVVQVLRSRHEETGHEEAMSLGEEALQEDKKGLFRFNSGKEQKTMPDYNPYTIKRCRDCDVAKGDVTLAFVPENQLCEACKMLHVCESSRGYYQDEKYGSRLMISRHTDQTELASNLRAAHALVSSFPKMEMTIREHVLEHGVKNPEYTINRLLADRKGIESPKGVQSGFKKAIKQGCKTVVVDLDERMAQKRFSMGELAKYLSWRSSDFEQGIISECYVVYGGKAALINREAARDRERIKVILKELKP